MKLVKLSLVAALAAGSLSALNAVSLEEAIKNVDFSGELRYRYDTSSNNNKASAVNGASSDRAEQEHRIRARLALSAQIADNFKAATQAEYGNTREGGYGSPTADENLADTGSTFHFRQAYLQYDNSDYATKISVGRQELGTFWTDDIVGISGKLTNSYLEGVTLAAFWVDGVDTTDGDQAFGDPSSSDYTATQRAQSDFFWKQNIYGAAAVTSFDLGGGSALDAQLWLGYMQNRATLYAVDAKYTLGLGEDMAVGFGATYLGNSLNSKLKDYLGKDAVANGSLIRAQADFEGMGIDAKLGAVMFGKKDKISLNTLEDQGGLDLGGKEIFYAKGSHVTYGQGKNTYFYLGAGYTLPMDLRIGAQYVFGSTEKGANGYLTGGGKKSEILAEASYKYSKGLTFSAFYSILDASSDIPSGADKDAYKKNTARLEAKYKF